MDVVHLVLLGPKIHLLLVTLVTRCLEAVQLRVQRSHLIIAISANVDAFSCGVDKKSHIAQLAQVFLDWFKRPPLTIALVTVEAFGWCRDARVGAAC